MTDVFASEFEPLRTRLVKLALKYTKVNAEAHDLAQDTLTRIASRLHVYTPGTDALAFASVVMRHLAIDRSRKRRVEEQLVGDDVPDIEFAPDGDPADYSEALSDQMQTALLALSPKLRDALWLTAVERLPQRTAAAHLGIGVNTLNSRAMRAREQMRELLEAA